MMRALIFENSMPRLAATKILSSISPRAFVGLTSPIRLREFAEPSLPAPDWAIASTQICGLCGSDYKQVFMMPPVSKRQLVAPERLVDAIMSALARGKRELTFPRWIASGYLVQALAPEFMRRQVRRNTIDALDREAALGLKKG